MIAFDTNVLLRLLLNDDARQAQQAQALVDRAVSRSDQVLLPDIVLCELEWVMGAVYGVPKPEIVQTLRRLLDTKVFAFLDPWRRRRSASRLRVGQRRLLRLPDRRIRRPSGGLHDVYLRPRPAARRGIRCGRVTQGGRGDFEQSL